MSGARILAIEYALPAKEVSNAELDAAHPGWNLANLAQRTGVVSRFVAGEEETALDLSIEACHRLFERCHVTASDCDALLVCTQTPDYVMPGNAALLQARLGLPTSVLAFDFTLACSGFVYGLVIAKALVESGSAKNVLLVTAETYSKHISPDDRATVALFGDGAAATMIVPGNSGIGAHLVGTDGAGALDFCVPAGGARRPRSQETNEPRADAWGNVRTEEQVHMDGAAVTAFVRHRVASEVRRLLAESGRTWTDIDLVVFHQASALSLDVLETELHVPPGKSFRNLAHRGNTVSASIPMALRDAELAGRLRSGDRVLIVGFGVGYSWGACFVDW